MTHTLSGEVIPLSDEWERLPEMQRLITLDGVIYVHQNPKRRRRRVAAQAVPAGAYAEPSAAWGVAEPVGCQPMADWESESSDGSALEAEVAAVAAPRWEAEDQTEAEDQEETEDQAEAEAHGEIPWEGHWADPSAQTWPDPSPHPTVAVTEPAANTRTTVRSEPMAPPPGYAVEFGTGRLVRIHSFKGRMSYPSSDWPD